MANEIEKEEYDGRKDLVSKVLEISSLIITIVLGLVTIGSITLEREVRSIIMISSIFLAFSITCGVFFLWFSPSYRSKIVSKGNVQARYGMEKWTYVSFKNITWKKLRITSKLQVLFFFFGMTFLLIALLWKLELIVPLD